ncbi:MAG: hypothetical protein HPY53_06425 [Brevinematales bacterium]|nr:hypothetical protein [Brevinematales bacterium]
MKKVWDFRNAGFNPDFNSFVYQTNADPAMFKLAMETRKAVDSFLKPGAENGLERVLKLIDDYGTNASPEFLGAVTLLYYYTSPDDDRKILDFFGEHPEMFILALNSREWVKNRYYKDRWLDLLKKNKGMIGGDTEGFIYLQYKLIFTGDFSKIPSPLGFLTDSTVSNG